MKTINRSILLAALFLTTPWAYGQAEFLDVDDTPEAAAPAPAAPPPKTTVSAPAPLKVQAPPPLKGTSTSTASQKLECTPANQAVTLQSIAANPALAANLKTFMNGVEFKEGETYTRELEGRRKNPAGCAGLFGSIDLVGCQKYKAAGQSQFQVRNNQVFYMADARDGVVPINLSQICSDGVSKMRFKFLYHKKFLTVTAGPWLYTIEVNKRDGVSYSKIVATVLGEGGNKVDVVMNDKPIKVGPVQVTGGGGYEEGFDDIEPTSAGARR